MASSHLLPNEWRRDSVDLTPFVYHQQFRVVFRIRPILRTMCISTISTSLKKTRTAISAKTASLIWPNAFSRQFYIEFATWPDDLLGTHGIATLPGARYTSASPSTTPATG